MFKRTIQLDVVKKARNKVDELNDYEDGIDRIAIYGAAFERAVFQVAKVVAAYMVLDTVRKIAVNKLSK